MKSLRYMRALTQLSFITIGADHHNVYTNKDVGEKNFGDSGLRSQLRMPKDLCVALTQESSGSVFNRYVSAFTVVSYNCRKIHLKKKNPTGSVFKKSRCLLDTLQPEVG